MCIYFIVPRGALLGRAQVAATLYSVSLLCFAPVLWAVTFLPSEINRALTILVFVIFSGNFLLIRNYFLRFGKQRILLQKYGQLKRWKFKAAGILFIVFSCAVFIVSGILLTLYER